MPASPVLVIGLDGVDSRYIDRFSDALPTIRRLRRDGLAAPLESTHPPWTGSAWPSLYTGVDPSYHGVYDFFSNRDGYPDETDAVFHNSSSDADFRRIYEAADDAHSQDDDTVTDRLGDLGYL